MGLKRTDEFRADAVRIALTSKWVTAHRDADVVSDKDLDLARENERLRRENRILKEVREIPKKGETIFRHWSEDNGRTSFSRAKSYEV